jgi:PAS domain S-box-containing protein
VLNDVERLRQDSADARVHVGPSRACLPLAGCSRRARPVTQVAAPMQKLKLGLFEHRLGMLLVLLTLLPALAIGWIASSLMFDYIKSERIKMVGQEADAKHAQLVMVLTRESERTKLLLSLLSAQCSERITENRACVARIMRPHLIAENALGAALFRNGSKIVTIGNFVVQDEADLELRPGQLAKFYGTGTADNLSYFVAAAEPSTGWRLEVSYPSSNLESIFDHPAPTGAAPPGDPVESFLVDGAGYFVTPSRYSSVQGHVQPVSTGPLSACLNGKSGSVLDLDYRDAKIIHGFRYLPELGSGCLMAHMDQAEAFAPVAALEKKRAAIFLIFFPLVAWVAWGMGARITKAEGLLRASENKFHFLFEAANDGLMVLDMQGRIVDVNHAVHERLGYAKEEMVGKKVGDFAPPGFVAEVPAYFAEIHDSGQGMFQSVHMRRDGSVMPIEVNARVVELDGEQRVFGVIRDITERERMDNALREREAQYRAVIETSENGFWIVDMGGRLLEVNDAYVRRSGYSREELLVMSIPDVEAVERPEDTAAHIQKILCAGHDRFESQHCAKDGSIWPVEVVASYWPIGGGRLFVSLSDITERKLMEQATLESEQRYRSLFDNLLDGFALFKVLERDGRIQDFSCVETNDVFQHLTGLKDVIGKTGRDIIPGIRGDNPEFFEIFSRVALGGKPERLETYLQGMHKWYAISVYSPERGYVAIVFDNITARKHSEQMTSTRLDYLTRQANDIILLADREGGLVDVNDRAIEIYGYTADEFSTLNIAALCAPGAAYPFEEMQQKIENEGAMRFDSMHMRKKGSYFPVEVSVRVIRIDEEIFVQSIVRDISERKRAEQVLLEKERRLAEAQHLAKLGSWEWNVATGEIYWSDELYRILGQEPAQPLPAFEGHLALFSPGCRVVFEVAVEQARYCGQVIECDLELAVQDSTPRWVFARFEPVRDNRWAVIGIRGTFQDISERKRQEAMMEAANKEIADLYNNAPCGYHSLDKEGLIVSINNTELAWLGYRRSEIVGKMRLQDLLTSDSLPVFRETFPQLKERGWSRDTELELICKDGRVLPVMISATAIRDKAGDFLMSRSTVYDMTERKKMEQERELNARRLEELSQRMVAAQELERRWLANELHDRSSANLAALALNCKHITDALPPHILEEIEGVLEDTHALLSDTTVNIREVCANLRPTVLDHAGFWQALESYTQQFSRRTGIVVHLKRVNGEPHFAANVKSTLFRIAQEALTNSAKHAQASEIHIDLGKSANGSTVLMISDNGCGFDPDEPRPPDGAQGLGLVTMQERAEFIGGKFSYETGHGRGMHIRVELADNAGDDSMRSGFY